MGWRIYYADGTTAEGDHHTPGLRRAPSIGVVAIAHIDVNGRKTLHNGGDWYHWDGHEWHARTDWGHNVKKGELMADEAFQAVKAGAMEWLISQ